MAGVITALHHYPIKGFTPQPLARARLTVGGPFPGDRLFAVEDGPCGFDPAAPTFIPKTRFAVLAKIADVARARTHFDAASGVVRASATAAPDLEANLYTQAGGMAFADWLTALLGDAAEGPLRIVEGGGHRFLDHPLGHVSVLNLASVRDLGERLGRPVDPLRFRANIHFDGWPAWAENDWRGREIALGGARTRVFQPITRCAAPDVDPITANRDMTVTTDLHRLYGHLFCGIYVQATAEGDVAVGDSAYVDPL